MFVFVLFLIVVYAQIRKLLVISPRERITASQAIQHRFFLSVRTAVIKFNARKTFKLAIVCVRSLIRIRKYRFTPEVLNMAIIGFQPYKIKLLRKVCYKKRKLFKFFYDLHLLLPFHFCL